MLESLSSLLVSIRTGTEVKGVIITGAAEKAFCAGADIRFLNQASSLEVRELALLAVSVYHQIEVSGKIVIAALNCYALGGGLELAEACTLRVAARHALFGHPEVKIGASQAGEELQGFPVSSAGDMPQRSFLPEDWYPLKRPFGSVL